MTVRNKYWLILVGIWVPSFALAGASILWVLVPQTHRSQAIRVKLTETKQLYAVAQEAVRTDDQSRLVQTVERLDRRVSDFVVPLEGAPDLAFEIAQLANQTGIESFSMKPRNRQGLDTVPECERIGEKQIDVSFVAPFHRFAAFLNAMERHHPVLFVETFTIVHPQVQSADPQINMQLAVLAEKPQGRQL